MTIWQYKILFAGDISNMDHLINTHAAEGWELFNFQVIHPAGHKTTFYSIMRRPRPETKPG